MGRYKSPLMSLQSKWYKNIDVCLWRRYPHTCLHWSQGINQCDWTLLNFLGIFMKTFIHWWWGCSPPGPWCNIIMSCYKYRKSHSGGKMVVNSSYIHSGISYTDKMWSLYWIGVQVEFTWLVWCLWVQCAPADLFSSMEWGQEPYMRVWYISWSN